MPQPSLTASWSLTTPAGIPYEELEGSPTLQYQRTKATATRIFHIEWDQQDAFVEEAFAPTVLTGPGWTAYQPVAFPGKNWLFLTSLNIEPFDPGKPDWDATAGHNSYTSGAKITAQYATTDYQTGDISGGSGGGGAFPILWNLTTTVGAEVLRLKGAVYRWTSTGAAGGAFADKDPIKNEEGVLARIIGTMDHKLTVYNVLDPPVRENIAQYIGFVNSVAMSWFPDGTLDSPAVGTMLFLGLDLQPKFLPNGLRVTDMVYHFVEKTTKNPQVNEDQTDAIGWNYFWNEDVSNWDTIEDDTGGYVYPEIDFLTLFKRS